MIRIYRSGPHIDRSPLSYPALASLFRRHVRFVAQPAQAELFLFAHSLDIEAMSSVEYAEWDRRRCPMVLVSEEPFWDTIWGKEPLHATRNIETRFGPVPVFQINHHTSNIFDFEHIPYYLLTNHRFASAYASHFRRNAALRPREWRRTFESYAVDTTFMAERRPEKYHNVRYPDGDIIGLCAWRSELAEACEAGKTERLGRSWDNGRSRFELQDWHLDKLTRLKGHSRVLSGLENTHQPNYLSEKFFDAFALGARPLYFASGGHRVHGFDLPAASWLNLYDLSVPDAVDAIENLTWDAAFFDAYTEAQNRLEALFTQPELFAAERLRLKKAVVRALIGVLDQAP